MGMWRPLNYRSEEGVTVRLCKCRLPAFKADLFSTSAEDAEDSSHLGFQ